MEHVKNVKAKHGGMALKEVLKLASKSYKGGDNCGNSASPLQGSPINGGSKTKKSKRTNRRKTLRGGLNISANPAAAATPVAAAANPGAAAATPAVAAANPGAAAATPAVAAATPAAAAAGPVQEKKGFLSSLFGFGGGGKKTKKRKSSPCKLCKSCHCTSKECKPKGKRVSKGKKKGGRGKKKGGSLKLALGTAAAPLALVGLNHYLGKPRKTRRMTSKDILKMAKKNRNRR